MIGCGYCIVSGVLSHSDCDALITVLDGVDTRGRAGERHLRANVAVAAIARDQRLLEIARNALDGAAVPYRATLFMKSSQANWLVAWHQDTALPLVSRIDDPGWGPWSEKVGVLYSHAPAWALAGCSYSCAP